MVQVISGLRPYVRLSVASAAAAMLAAGSAQAATVTRSVFGTAADGQTVYLFTLKNHHGMTVKFSTRGGSIVEIDAPDRKGVEDNLVIGKADFAGWESGANAILGRYANRIGGGGFTLDGTFYKLSGPNPKTNVVIHGGTDNYFHKLWKGEAFQHGDEAGATLSLVSPDGESGFPGELTIKVNYSLDEHNRLKLEYWATTTKPTVINLSNHANFNIGGYDSGPVYNQVLQVFASHYTPTDAAQVPTGEIAPVAGTPFDFRKPTAIGARINDNNEQLKIAGGYDHNWVLNGKDGEIKLAATLYDPKSGRVLTVNTTQPGVQFYSGNFLDGSYKGVSGAAYSKNTGLCLETQHYPDSPNQDGFPSTLLKPGETMHSETVFAFSTQK